ncbi:LysR family transcriptional regulator [Pseudonocardia sp. TRM90224]|uniref:LysR family transcriptional regulator n=1 Tax=Pseudonocardia sp. TRM90224 TaxID=2812678 RepID=UPI001E519713|nr:LysR family transcriptional regulator [Pseudonocardia sp. TRM90224]
MELRQLAYFDAVVRHGGFGRAAEQLHVAQPAISVQVKKLEAELGVALLSRTTRRVRLTEAGELFLRRVHGILAELDAARTDMARLAGGVIGTVRIGAIQALEPLDLPGALAAFHTRHPDVELTLRSGALRQLIDDLDGDRIDLALGPVPSGLPEHLVAEPLFADELVLVTSPDHPTAASDALAIETLSDEPFVCLPADSGLRGLLNRLCDAAGFTPKVPFETTNLPRLRDLVAQGLGVALVARSVAEAPGRPVAIHPVHPERVWRPVGVIHHGGRPLGPAAEACRELLIAHTTGRGARGGQEPASR